MNIRTIEDWHKVKGTSPWITAGCYIMSGGVEGLEMSETEYDDLVQRVQNDHVNQPLYPVRGVK